MRLLVVFQANYLPLNLRKIDIDLTDRQLKVFKLKEELSSPQFTSCKQMPRFETHQI